MSDLDKRLQAYEQHLEQATKAGRMLYDELRGSGPATSATASSASGGHGAIPVLMRPSIQESMKRGGEYESPGNDRVSRVGRYCSR